MSDKRLPSSLPPLGWTQGAHKDGLDAFGIVNLRFNLLSILIMDESLSIFIDWRVFLHYVRSKRRIGISEERFHPVVRHP